MYARAAGQKCRWHSHWDIHNDGSLIYVYTKKVGEREGEREEEEEDDEERVYCGFTFTQIVSQLMSNNVRTPKMFMHFSWFSH